MNRFAFRNNAETSFYSSLVLSDFLATDTLGVGGFGRVELVCCLYPYYALLVVFL